MKSIRIVCWLLAITLPAALFAADPAGTWKWSTTSPGGDIPTTLKLEWKEGRIVGAYSNQYGDTKISNASLQDDVIKFDVVRHLGGTQYVVKYEGKIEGDTIKGTILAPGSSGGDSLKLDWNAKRSSAKENGDGAQPKG